MTDAHEPQPAATAASDDAVAFDAPLPDRIAAAVQRYGEAGLVRHALGLLEGRNEGEDVLLYLGGRHAKGLLEGAPALYWPEVWGARALLNVWDDSAASAVLRSVGNRAWRVREMCLKVCAERGLGDVSVFEPVTRDENARVRAAAARALAAVGGTGAEDAITRLLRDQEKDVRRAAGESRKTLAARNA